jgi:hypothetical protein
MSYRENIRKKKKNYLYYNSIAAHPYNWIGDRVKDRRVDGFLLQRLFHVHNIYNKMNKWMKKLGEI